MRAFAKQGHNNTDDNDDKFDRRVWPGPKRCTKEQRSSIEYAKLCIMHLSLIIADNGHIDSFHDTNNKRKLGSLTTKIVITTIARQMLFKNHDFSSQPTE